MPRKLEVAGIALVAAGLLILAFEDPIIRILIYGSSTGAAAARTAFTSGSGGTSSFTAFRSSAAGGGASEILETFTAFGASVIGLILVVTAALTRRSSVQPATNPDQSK